MMKLPKYWLQSPKVSIDQSEQSKFDQLYSRAILQESGSKIDYTLAAPKWKFLNYLIENHKVVMHGSGNPNIAMFEPRKADDVSEFGNQKAVYAAADGIWAMFFAIIDRRDASMTVNNACIEAIESGESFYLFSISQNMLNKQPWKEGVVYLLPSDTFVEQAPMQLGEHSVRIKQQVSLVPVKPLARIEIMPEDFPFLAEIRGHDDARMDQYAEAMLTGGAWPD